MLFQRFKWVPNLPNTEMEGKNGGRKRREKGRKRWMTFFKDLKFKLSEELLLEEAGRGGVVSCGASFLSLHRDI